MIIDFIDMENDEQRRGGAGGARISRRPGRIGIKVDIGQNFTGLRHRPTEKNLEQSLSAVLEKHAPVLRWAGSVSDKSAGMASERKTEQALWDKSRSMRRNLYR